MHRLRHAWSPVRGAFVCELAVRPNLSTRPELRTRITLSGAERRSASLGGFRFEAGYGEDRYEGRSFATSVYLEATGKLIERSLFELAARGPVNQFIGGHGFTGLHYLYGPSGAELQYYCNAAAGASAEVRPLR
jgi:hypothetical protein